MATFVDRDTTFDFIKRETDLLNLPNDLVNANRIVLLNLLFLHEFLEFRDLKIGTGTTDGNLASHLRALEKSGRIERKREREDVKGREKFVYNLTDKGKQEINALIESFRVLSKLYKSQK